MVNIKIERILSLIENKMIGINYYIIFRADCESQVKGFSGAIYKKFNTLQEAETFIASNNGRPMQSTTSSYSRKVSARIYLYFI